MTRKELNTRLQAIDEAIDDMNKRYKYSIRRAEEYSDSFPTITERLKKAAYFQLQARNRLMSYYNNTVKTYCNDH